MRRVVLDASVVMKWFKPEDETSVSEARLLRQEYEAGTLRLAAPFLLPFEVLNALARRWRWGTEDLGATASALDELAVDYVQPDLVAVTGWVGRGLSAYDAAYLAVAEQERAPLITADERLLVTAKGVAVGLTERET